MRMQTWDFTGVEIWPGAAMDYPTAWAFVKTTSMNAHHPKCSYRQTNGAILCDCQVIGDENTRIKKLAEESSKGGDTRHE